MEAKIRKIQELKKEKNAVIMAHYYVPDEVQDIADYVGDSYYLSEMATKVDAEIIVLCGVSFMGESAKILNTEKKVLLPAADADCPMAHMADTERIAEVREEYEALSCDRRENSAFSSFSRRASWNASGQSISPLALFRFSI